ncbi:MAG TPA: hypothetical protein VFZ44_01985 [Pyrinomonadaceae bacterium]
MVKAGKIGEEVNISELARRSGLNRATVREKLESKGVHPRQKKAKEKLYDLDEALGALQGDGTAGLRKAQTMKTATEAARAKLRLDRERGDLVPIQDVRADLQEVVKRIYQHFAVTNPPAVAPQLRGKKLPQIEATLRRDAEQFFRDLRAEFDGYLNAED